MSALFEPGERVRVVEPPATSRFRSCSHVGERGTVVVVDPWRASYLVRTEGGATIGEPHDHLRATRS